MVEAVTAFLELQDIRNLRLASQTIAVKSGRRTFKRYFANKTLNWKSRTELQILVQMTQPQRMGCFLKSLTIKGRAPTASRKYSKEIALLTEALTNLRHNSVYGGLESVILTVKGQIVVRKGGRAFPETFPHWSSFWQTASETLEITSQALSESGVSVQKLDIFGSIKRCSLACNKIAPLLEQVELSKTLINLKQLSLSLSHHLGEGVENSHDETPEIDLATGQGYVNDTKHLLDLCPHLESLELHWYDLRRHELSGAQMEERGFFSKIAQLDNHFSVAALSFRRYLYRWHCASTFFKQTTQLTSLTMDHVHLKSGTFAPVFDFLTNHLPHLSYLHLESLSERNRICFDGQRKPWLPSTCPTNGPNELTRTGVDCRRAIEHRFFEGHVQGSFELVKWRRRQALLYGPPL